MGQFRFTSPEQPAAVLDRLRAEGRRRPGDVMREVRRVGTELGVRVDGRRFRVCIFGVGRSASMPVADGEVQGAPNGAVVTGRIRHARLLLPLLVLWSGAMLSIAVSFGAWWFSVFVALYWGAGVIRVLTYRRAAQEKALLAVLARCVRGGDPPASAPPNETLELTKPRIAPR